MKTTNKFSDSFNADDIRKLRDDFARRHTDENGNIDWDRAFAETEEGAALVRAELDRIRAERAL